jgi:hypothetical protein
MSGTGALHMPLIEAPLAFRLRSGGAQAKDKAFITCPNCEAPMFVRHSTRETETVKHLVVHCTNSGCGLIGMEELVFVHFYNPGACLRPDLNLKPCPRHLIPHIVPPSADTDDGQISMFGGPR